MSNLHTLVRDLQRRKARERRGLVLAEGRRLVAEALASGLAVRGLLAADDAAEQAVADVLAEAARRGVPTEIVARRRSTISPTPTRRAACSPSSSGSRPRSTR